MARGKVKCRIEREKRGHWRVYDVTQVTYEIIIDFRRPSCELRCTRATLVSFPYHVRHFCGAHTPIFYSCTPTPQIHQPSPNISFVSFFFPPYRVSTIARTPAFGYLLFAGTFVRRSDYHHYSSRTHLRDTAKRPRDDTAFLRARARVHCVDESTRVVSDRNVKIIALQFARNRLEYPPRVVIVENPLL